MANLGKYTNKLVGMLSQLSMHHAGSATTATGVHPSLTTLQYTTRNAFSPLQGSSQQRLFSARDIMLPIVPSSSMLSRSPSVLPSVWSTAVLQSSTNFRFLTQISSSRSFHTSLPHQVNTLERMHEIGIRKKPPKKKNPLGFNIPMLRGVVLKTLIKKPKKPNSANRKCVLVRLSNGKEMVAFVPGIGHTLQEHNTVMVVPGRLRDTPGVKVRCVRGCYDLGQVTKK